MSKIQHSFEIQIPSRSMDTVVNALGASFPYREGDWFDQTVSGPRAPVGQGLAYIRLDQPLSEEQKTYLEQDKNNGQIDHYGTHEVATW